MPISHDHRFIFIHLPKTAGTSIVEAFLRRGALDFAGRDLWPRLVRDPRGAALVRDLRNFYALNSIVHFPEQHLPARILRELVPADVWSSYFKFAFVRNPWDVVVSSYHFMKEMFRADPSTAAGDPDIGYLVASVDFTNFVRARPYFAAEQGFLPHLCDAAGNLLVDYVGRFERIDEDLAAICRRIGIELQVERANPSSHGQYREYYIDETREIIAREFARDIEAFGYTF